MKCRICENGEHNTLYSIEEMRFGMGEAFTYFKCARCGCLQIAEYPENISKYYPPHYYSFSNEPVLKKSNFLKLLALSPVAHQCTGRKNTLPGRIMYNVLGGGTVEKIKGSGVGLNDKILEIGSGTGNNLVRLYKYGFKNLWGIDPFIDEDVIYNDQIKVLRKSVIDLEEREFDLAFLNHAFEHMPDPYKVMKAMSRLVKKGRFLIITIPIIDCYHWRKYGVNWVGLSAPRHYYLHSVKSMKLIAESAGLKIDHIDYKTSPFHFWASEQYSLGIPLQAEKSHYMTKKSPLFPEEVIKQYKEWGKTLDDVRDGATAVFYLLKQ